MFFVLMTTLTDIVAPFLQKLSGLYLPGCLPNSQTINRHASGLEQCLRTGTKRSTGCNQIINQQDISLMTKMGICIEGTLDVNPAG